MPYLTAEEIETHLYGEVVNEISRNNDLLPFPSANDFPAEGDPTKTYKALDTGKYYQWASVAYVETTYNDKLQTAIDSAVEEARGYLTMLYDVEAIFTAEGNSRNPILLLYVKDIAVWHFIQLSNPSVDMELRLKRYDQAVSWLGKVQSGRTNPNLPQPAAPANDAGQLTTAMKWGGNKRRNNYLN